jgi:hypothetical protein
MTDQNYTHIELIVDASGSMHSLTDDTVKGINSLLADQRKLDGKVTVSYTTFNTYPLTQFSMRPINEVPPISYHAGGGTALLDAVGKGIDSLGRLLRLLPSDERPGNVVVAVITDGEENSSRMFRRDQIKEMVTEQQDRYSWAFLFMGANIDSFHEAASLGIHAGSTMDWNPAHIGSTYASASTSIMRGRQAASAGVSGQSLVSSYNFTQEEREEALGETDPNTP